MNRTDGGQPISYSRDSGPRTPALEGNVRCWDSKCKICLVKRSAQVAKLLSERQTMQYRWGEADGVSVPVSKRMWL